MKRALLLSFALALIVQADGQAQEKKGKKVQVFVKASAVPGTGLASDLKKGKRITDVVLTTEPSAKMDLSDISKGTGERPKPGAYFPFKMTVYKGKDYAAHDVYLSEPLPKGTKLRDFMYQG